MDVDINILIVTTSFSKVNDDWTTGVWFEEFAIPYMMFKKSGFKISVASPKGGSSPIDPNSIPKGIPKEFKEEKNALAKTQKLDTVEYLQFDGIFLPGGHGPMFDLVNDPSLRKILEYMNTKNKLISAICHGPAGLLSAPENGKSILKGKKITAFSNEEEILTNKSEFIPFSLEDKLKKAGAIFVKEKPGIPNVVIGENIITGQNPKSSELIAKAVIDSFS